MAFRHFAFFGKKLSRKAGEKCCIYGQNGKPLSKEYVQNFLSTASPIIQLWRPSSEFTSLRHAWYFTDYLQAAAFVLEVAKLDSGSVLKQRPEVSLLRKELLTIELYTPLLGGLSNADLELAVQISFLPSASYSLTPISDERNYRAELRKAQLDAATDKILKESKANSE